MASIADLANLGPKSALFLQCAGIRTIEDLRRLGSVAAYAEVKKVEPKASLNLLWALEGALTGLHWREVAREHRTSLLLALETHVQRDSNQFEHNLASRTVAVKRRGPGTAT